ncbi:hypothetical protein, partial [Solemya velum gill symbiont]|uniref:hypothetical protein n=1 Tax=Solemya velum gill symbiont TaxID=2340 RepID=UPI001E620805
MFYLECIQYQTEHLRVAQFADDSSIWASSYDIYIAKRKIEQDLSNIITWCNNWGFKLSETKTVTLIFTRRKIPSDIQIFLGNIPIKIVTTFKLLGVMFDQKMIWSTHVEYLLVKCKAVLNLLKCLAGTEWGGHPKQMLKIYRALVRSRLDYGCQVYNSASPSVKSKLNTVQAQGLRICQGVPRTT